VIVAIRIAKLQLAGAVLLGTLCAWGTASTVDAAPAGKVSPQHRKVMIEGALSKRNVKAVIIDNLNDVRRCYAAGLKKDPELAGRVTLVLTVRGDGSVAQAITSCSLPDKDVGECIGNEAKAWRFAPTHDGKNAVVSYPFVLEPS
jgi:hypothetical protein